MNSRLLTYIPFGVCIGITPLATLWSGCGIFASLYLTVATLCVMAFTLNKRNSQINITDITVTVFLVYSLLNLFFVRPTPPDPLMIYNWGMLTGVYVTVRNFENKQIVVLFITLSGVAQALVGAAQIYGTIPSFHSDFMVTGTFQNPGPYAGFLALSLVSAISLLHNQSKHKPILWGSVVILLIMLIVADSRAAGIAALIGCIVQFPSVRKKWGYITAIAVICTLVTGLYFYRPGSAYARLLVWEVCTRLIGEKPIMGHGTGTLPQLYMNAQAEYFAINPDAEFSMVSNNNHQAFNEFIHLGVEHGIIGIILLLCIIFTCRKSACFPLILTWCTFSSFSYPADIQVLMVAFVAGIAICSSGKIWLFNYNSKWFLCSLIIIPFAIITNISYNRALKHTATATVAEFPQNMEYMLQYAKQKQHIPVFEQLTQNVCSSSEILCDMGDAYFKQDKTGSADSCYQLANKMVPCRILPLHKLFLLYEKTDSIKAKNYAYKIIGFKSPATGSVVLRARADAKKYLSDE